MERKTIVLDVQVLKRVRTTRCYSCTAPYTAPSVRPVPPRADHTGTAATTTIIHHDVVPSSYHPTIRYWESTMAVEIQPGSSETAQSPYAVVNERSLEFNRNGMKPNLPHIILDVIYRYVANQIAEQNIDSANTNIRTESINRIVIITGYSEGIVYRDQNSETDPTKNTVCFRVRCHQSYRGRRPWHDWVNIQSSHNGDEISLTPCKILSIFSWNCVGLSQPPPVIRYMAAVWSVSSTAIPGEVLAERRLRMFASVEDDVGASMPIFSVIDLNAHAVNRVLVIEDNPSIQEIYHSPLHDRRSPHYCSVVSDMRRDWANEFTGAIGGASDYNAVVERRSQHKQQRAERELRRQRRVQEHISNNVEEEDNTCTIPRRRGRSLEQSCRTRKRSLPLRIRRSSSETTRISRKRLLLRSGRKVG